MKKLTCALLMALPFFSVPVFSKDAAVIPTVTVTGESTSAPQDSTSASTIILTSDYQNRVTSVAEVLEEQTGVHLTRFGGLDQGTFVSIRGSSPDEVLVLLDGIPLNTTTGGGVDLSPFILESLESIELYRGSSPVQFGLGAAAGSIYLRSKKFKEGQQLGASLGYGSFDTWKGNVFYSNTSKNFGFLSSVAVSRTEGDFTFFDNNGTPFNLNDDRRVKRQNNASQTIHPFFKLFYDFDKNTQLSWVAHVFRQDNGVPGITSNLSQSAQLETTSVMSALRFKRDKFLHPDINFESLTSFSWLHSHFSDPKGEIGLGGAQENNDDTHFFNQRFSMDVFLRKHQVVTAVVFYQMERFVPKNSLATPPQGSSSVRHRWNMGLADEINLLDGRLLISPLVWLENVYNQTNNQDPSFFTPAVFINNQSHHVLSAKLGVKGEPTSFLTLAANVARGFRFPTFTELFGDRGTVVGNPNLQPQQSLNWDAGVTLYHRGQKIKRAQLSLRYFGRNVINLIQFQQNSVVARAENVGKARIQGIEAEGRLSLWDHLSVSAHYTFQLAKDQATHPGFFLPGRPKHEVSVKVQGDIKKGSVFVSTQWIDSNFLDSLNTRKVNNRTLFNAGLSYQVHDKVTLAFEAKNLTNDQIVDVLGFPLPGRSFFGKVVFTL